jgi:nucleoid-associated protein YgaU
MSIRRLLGTTLAMALGAVALGVLTPGIPAMAADIASAQRTVDTAGPDALVVSAAGLLAWAVWAWGALGLTLTAASALPGLAGAAARGLLGVVLPAGARRSAALVLGLSLGVAGPVLATSSVLMATPAAAAPATSVGDVPDWPAAPDEQPAAPDWPAPAAHPSTPVPDWPTDEHPAGAHVIVRGDCLWHIAAHRLAERTTGAPTDAEIATEVHAWWAANTDVIGPDPDLLLPGQVLRPPAAP